MKIGILGSGVVGQTLSGALAERGHDVMVATRNPPKLDEWLEQIGNRARVGSLAEAAAHGELLFNVTNGASSLEALAHADAASYAGKIMIDVSNPLDFTQGMPPTLTVSNTDSLGEQIQRAYPEARVVKALNTVTAALMIEPALVADGEHHLFVCGDDAAAKAAVAGYLRDWFGWKHIVDLGDISAARATEMYLPLWLRLWDSVGTGLFNVRVVT